jgi:phosphoglucomutase/phosphomannomutase
MHGVGASSVCPALDAVGFKDVEVFGPHAEPNGDFPNVPGHVSNPENPATFDAMIEHAQESGAELILSTDPDADRLGCAAPRKSGGWHIFTGNQIACLLSEFLLAARQTAGTLSSDGYLVKTLVTTEMVRRIGDAYGVTTYGNLMVGFKWIAGLIDAQGPERFILGTEESHGYIVGTYARDKDAGVAAMLLAEMAAQVKAEGSTLADKLDDLFWQYGCHAEKTVSQVMPGAEGMVNMQRLMQQLRTRPPRSLAGIDVAQVRDYSDGVIRKPDGSESPLEGPRGSLVIFDLAESGNYVAVRPSGTEPKVKFYMFVYQAPELIAHLDDTKTELSDRLTALEADLAALAEKI